MARVLSHFIRSQARYRDSISCVLNPALRASRLPAVPLLAARATTPSTVSGAASAVAEGGIHAPQP